MDFTILSNFAFILPFLLSIYFQTYWFTVMISLTMLFSALWHIYGGKFFEKLDEFFAFVLIGSNFYLAYLIGFTDVNLYLAIILIGLGSYFFLAQNKKNYDFNHSVWHVFCALGTSFLLF